MTPEDELRLRLRAQAQEVSYQSRIEPRKHSCLLQFFLLSYIFQSVVAALALIFLLASHYLSIPPLTLTMLSAPTILVGVFAFFVLRWKRWAVIAFTALLTFDLLIRFLLNTVDSRSITSTLIGIFLVWYYIRPQWESFE